MYYSCNYAIIKKKNLLGNVDVMLSLYDLK